MEILFLYRAISKHCISDAANDRESLGKHSGKIKMYIVRDLKFQHRYIEMYFFPLLKISNSSAACLDTNFTSQSLKWLIKMHPKAKEMLEKK